MPLRGIFSAVFCTWRTKLRVDDRHLPNIQPPRSMVIGTAVVNHTSRISASRSVLVVAYEVRAQGQNLAAMLLLNTWMNVTGLKNPSRACQAVGCRISHSLIVTSGLPLPHWALLETDRGVHSSTASGMSEGEWRRQLGIIKCGS